MIMSSISFNVVKKLGLRSAEAFIVWYPQHLLEYWIRWIRLQDWTTLHSTVTFVQLLKFFCYVLHLITLNNRMLCLQGPQGPQGPVGFPGPKGPPVSVSPSAWYTLAQLHVLDIQGQHWFSLSQQQIRLVFKCITHQDSHGWSIFQ